MSVALTPDGQALALQRMLERLPDLLDDPAQHAWAEDILQQLLEALRAGDGYVFRYKGRTGRDYAFEVGPYGRTRLLHTRCHGVHALYELIRRHNLARAGTPMPQLCATDLAVRPGRAVVQAARNAIRRDAVAQLEQWGEHTLVSVALCVHVTSEGLLLLSLPANAPRINSA